MSDTRLGELLADWAEEHCVFGPGHPHAGEPAVAPIG
jgi:hypothetical protein